MVYYSERLHNEAGMRAGQLIAEGAIGRVLQVVNLAPHRLSKASRPAWFFRRAQYGGAPCASMPSRSQSSPSQSMTTHRSGAAT